MGTTVEEVILPELEGSDADWASAWEDVLDGQSKIEAHAEEAAWNERERRRAQAIWLEEPDEYLDAPTSFGGRRGDWIPAAESAMLARSGTSSDPGTAVEIPFGTDAFYRGAKMANTVPSDFAGRCQRGELVLLWDDGVVTFVDRKMTSARTAPKKP